MYSVGQIKYQSPSATHKFYRKYAMKKIKTCQVVGLRARRAGVNPMEAIAVSFIETRHNNKIRGGAGEIGAMQALPKYWLKSTDKNHIDAGLRAWLYYRKRSSSVQQAAGRYNGGGVDSAYAIKVQGHVDKLQKFFKIITIY